MLKQHVAYLAGTNVDSLLMHTAVWLHVSLLKSYSSSYIILTLVTGLLNRRLSSGFVIIQTKHTGQSMHFNEECGQGDAIRPICMALSPMTH